MRLIREEKDFIRDAILLMLPMILQNFVTFSMSMADTFMVGVLGETALAAVTMANSPFYVMQLMIFGVQSGMSVLVAQYHGRGDQPRHGHRAVCFHDDLGLARRDGVLHPGADHARAHQQR